MGGGSSGRFKGTRGAGSKNYKIESTYKLRPTHGRTLRNKEFNTLKADIKENGIKDTIKYVEHNGTKYVVDGHHRLLVAKQIGIKEIPIEKVSLPFKGYKTPDDLFWWGD